ncbi:molybdopterin-binding protein [Clostridium ljungdahlii]|uniref:TOBE domain-containing protein n=1 Tax=Clostridium ljungdahlii TaxID=1538 RepID=UPI003866BC6A
MIISARNQITGKTESVKEGAVNAIVTLKADDGNTITSTISMAAVKDLDLHLESKQKLLLKPRLL